MNHDYKFMADVAMSTLTGRCVPELTQEQPTTRKQRAYDAAYWAVLEGKDCAFYPTNEWRGALDSPVWDSEQEIAMFNAIKLAQSLIGATPEERYRVIENALREQAERYADYCAERV